MIRVVLTGAECTGKSTLAKTLSEHYDEPWTAEFVRSYVDKLDRPLDRKDLDPIAKGQMKTEDEPLERVRSLIIHDTNLFSSILYASHYFDAHLEWVNEAFRSRHYTVYLLCDPSGIEWEADPGQRESREVRDVLHVKFKEALISAGQPYFELKGSKAERLNQAILVIEELLNRSKDPHSQTEIY